jgi:hypothetical protein
VNTADPLTTSVVAACVALLMVRAGIGKRMLVWRVAAERRGDPTGD